MAVRRVLAIAGSDSGAGAGVQADIKTCMALGVYCSTAITAVTAQNTLGVQGVHGLPADFVVKQVRSVLDDIGADAIKTGMLQSGEVVRAVAATVAEYSDIPLVVDPVLVATSGDALAEDDMVATLRAALIPQATVITPNLPETSTLLGRPVRDDDEQDIRAAAVHLVERLGCSAALVKGGHAKDANASIDILYDGQRFEAFAAPRLNVRATHGTGCSLASATAAGLAQGLVLRDAVDRAKRAVWEAMKSGCSDVGRGHTPLHHVAMAQALAEASRQYQQLD